MEKLPEKLEVRDLILNTCREMILISKKEFEGKWRDQSNDEGLVIVNEALVSFLIPSSSISKIKDDILSDEVLSKKNIISIVNLLINLSEDDFYGNPYLDFSVYDEEEKNHGFIDAACLTITNIYLLKKLFWSELADDTKIQLNTLFSKGLKFIDDSYIQDKGWSWGTYDKPDEPFIYPTWMVFETITDFIEDSNLTDYISEDDLKKINILKNKLDKIKIFMENKYILSKSSEKFNKNLTKGTIAFSEKDRSLHYNLWVLISLLLAKSDKAKEIEEAIQIIWDEFQTDERTYLKQPITIYFDGMNKIKDAEFTDRAFLPLFLKSFSIFIKNYPNKIKKYEKNIIKLYNLVIQNRNFDRYIFVWDKYAENDSGYAIYYTERCLEALCRFYQILSEDAETEYTEKVDYNDVELDEIIKILCYKIKPTIDYEDLEKRISNIEYDIKRIEENLPSDNDIMGQMLEDEPKIRDKINNLLKENKYAEAKELIYEALKTFPHSEMLINFKKGIEEGGNL